LAPRGGFALDILFCSEATVAVAIDGAKCLLKISKLYGSQPGGMVSARDFPIPLDIIITGSIGYAEVR
jgi:hypothetical protein